MGVRTPDPLQSELNLTFPAVTRAFSYTRFSTPEQELGDSLRRQLESAREYAQKNNWDLDESLKDRGVSAFRGKNAKEGALGRFLQEIEAGAVEPGSVLIVENVDRLSRQGAWETLSEIFPAIVNRGVTIVTLEPERVYSRETLSTNWTLMVELIVYAQKAHSESVTKVMRLQEVWKAKRKQAEAKALTANGPSWLHMDPGTRRFEPIPERAAIVHRIFEEALAGMGTYAIAEGLNRDGVPVFGRGRFWHRSFVARVLHNPAVIGTLVPHTLDYVEGRKVRNPQEPVPNYYPSVVTEDAFRRIQAMGIGGSSPRRGVHATAPVQNIFGGLARCARCGGSMVRINKGKEAARAYLACSKARVGAGCKYTAVPYGAVELAFLEQLDWTIAAAPVTDASDGIDRELAEIDAALGGLSDLYDDTLTAARRGVTVSASRTLRDLEGQRDELEKRQRELQERRDATASPLLTRRLQDLGHACEAEQLDRGAVNTLMRQIFDAVQIDPDVMTLHCRFKQGSYAPSISYGFPPCLD